MVDSSLVLSVGVTGQCHIGGLGRKDTVGRGGGWGQRVYHAHGLWNRRVGSCLIYMVDTNMNLINGQLTGKGTSIIGPTEVH